MRKLRKKYKRPLILWDKERIEKDRVIIKNFGLKKKQEIWVAETLLRKFRKKARDLAAKKDKDEEKALVQRIINLGMLEVGAGLDDVLDLNVENVLERRLQSLVHRKGLVTTPKQARQMIVHGHVFVDGRKIVYPSYMVSRAEESKIQVGLLAQKPKKVEEKVQEVVANEK